MLTFPQQAAFNRTIAETRIYDHAQPSKAVRNRFVQEVESIVWSYKLAPETINLPSSPGVHEIQVFTLTAKIPEVSEIVLRTIDEAIPSPLFFRICHDDRVRGRIAYKRPSEAATDAWVVEDGFTRPLALGSHNVSSAARRARPWPALRPFAGTLSPAVGSSRGESHRSPRPLA